MVIDRTRSIREELAHHRHASYLDRERNTKYEHHVVDVGFGSEDAAAAQWRAGADQPHAGTDHFQEMLPVPSQLLACHGHDQFAGAQSEEPTTVGGTTSSELGVQRGPLTPDQHSVSQSRSDAVVAGGLVSPLHEKQRAVAPTRAFRRAGLS
jgi:hypothetical protein